MIAKRIANPKKTSSILRLVNYIADPVKQQALQQAGQENGLRELVSYMDKPQAVVRITNCGFDSMSSAIWEMQATQKKNTRSKNDKTYHLVISFREGEQPAKEILEVVEDKIVERIGFEEHQRISALHTDTNNWHLHVAINKVHPGTYRNVEPYFDKLKMLEACRELEKEFGLLPDNGVLANKSRPMNPAQDKEAHTGIKSLVSWIREKAVAEIKAVLEDEQPDWSKLHQVLNRHGLTIRHRGAGFVIQDISSGLTVKASSVDRSFSKKKIETILGAYQQSKVMHTAREHYKEEPVQPATSARDKLWKQYKKERDKMRSARAVQLKTISGQRKDYLKKVFADIEARKNMIRQKTWLGWRHKKEVYASLQIERLQALETSATVYRQRRDLINNRYPVLTWTAFLQREAEKGNETAVKLLRQGKGKSIHDQANFINRGNNMAPIFQDLQYRIDKRGRITYQLRKGWVLDAGNRVLPGSMDHNVLVATLQIAAGKYGRKLRVEGSREFVERVTRAAYDRRLNVIINGRNIRTGPQRRREKGLER